MKRIKLLYLISNLRRTGPVLQLYNIVKYLDRSIFDPMVLTISPEEESSLINEFLELNLPVMSLNWQKGSLPPRKLYVERINELSPDIVHSHGIRADVIAKSLRETGYVRFSTIHCDPLEDYPRLYRLKGVLAAIAHIFTLRGIDNLVACSGSLAEGIYHKYGLRACVILNSADISDRLYSTVVSEQIRTLKRKPDDFIFIYVGELIKRKNLNLLVNGFKRVPENLKLVIAGDGPERKNLEVDAPSNVTFVGRQKDVVSFLFGADAYVSASLSEGLPTAVLEALAMGLPVLLSDIPSHVEIFSLARKAGASIGSLFKNRDLNDFVQKILSFPNLTFDKAEIIKFFNIFFSPEKMSKEYQELYLQKIKGRSVR
ncbi:glycosyltransferase [Pseudothermotoga sp. U03pept]|uniref:glycosyltransferase n=1 Tax=Pseudothermotoga sp. U03pept TaxID=3447012 RepID=UPI003EFE3A17